jgi:hypothetical protein
MRWGRWVLAGVALVCLLPFTVCSPNHLDLWMSRGWFVPAESDVWDFRPTSRNSGSGEWWMYGEDEANYYALHLHQPFYLILPRSVAPTGFDPLDYVTWGPGVIMRPIP